MEESTITAKGQTTIPKAIRDQLGLKPGSKIKFFVRHDGLVEILAVLPAGSLPPPSPYRGRPISVEEMDDAIAAEVAREPRTPDAA